jgi:hypothetical protein
LYYSCINADAKQDIIEGLMDYYTRGNCGLVDAMNDTAHALCSETSDYQIVIQKLEAHLQKSGFRSYYQSLLSQLYGEIGDTDSQLRILQSHLEYGMDYWRLAQYWIENGDQANALQIVQQGIDNGQGRKTELYAFMQERLQAQGDVDGIFDLLLRKIKHNDLDHHCNLIHDSTYQYLANYYAAQHDYDGQVKLLELCLTSEQVDLDFYTTAEKTLTPTDWPKFAKRIIANLQKAMQKAAPSPWLRRVGQECQTLAAIYAYKNDLEPLCDIARTDMSLLAKYESKLLPHYPELYLDVYISARLID